MIPALQRLTEGLHRVFLVPVRHPEMWFDLQGIGRAKEQVIRDHGSTSIAFDERTILASVEDFRRSGTVTNFRELKYVCVGISSTDAHGWCILADERLRRLVMALAEGQQAVSRKLQCFQMLLSAYFSFRLTDADTKADARAGWKELRAWLRCQRLVLLDKIDNCCQWFGALNRHSALLTDKPCDKFGAALLRGDASELNDALSSLAIASDSWVMEAAVLAQMRAAVKFDDRDFKEWLPRLVPMATGQVGVKISGRLQIECVRQLVSRYAKSSATPEHPGLRDAALSVIGNPWLCKTKWDAFVVMDDGRPDQIARQMVFRWLKGRLIQDFFELLSAEGSGDKRRLDYWLRFAPLVDDMWFALGREARGRDDTNFRQFRERAKGRLLDLGETTSENNAFVMQIGAYLAIEFGSKGNAFFLLERDKLPKAVSDVLISGKDREPIAIALLKPSDHKYKGFHRDTETALKSWEQKFDDELLPIFEVKQGDLGGRAACVPDLERLLEGRDDIMVVDTRASGGALRLTPEERLAPIARQLERLGMVRRPNRGWFKE